MTLTVNKVCKIEFRIYLIGNKHTYKHVDEN